MGTSSPTIWRSYEFNINHYRVMGDITGVIRCFLFRGEAAYSIFKSVTANELPITPEHT